MAMNGIFCLETDWLDERKPASSQYLLALLERMSGIPFVYRDVATTKELDFYLGRWCGRNTKERDYQLHDLGILYLGFHGCPGQIDLYDDSVSLVELAKGLTHSKNQYSLSGSVIHFASCSVMDSPETVKDFKTKVGASCVTGYREEVDFASSWAFELMYLGLLSNLMSTDEVNADTLRDLDKTIEKEPEYKGLAEKLGFKMIF